MGKKTIERRGAFIQRPRFITTREKIFPLFMKSTRNSWMKPSNNDFSSDGKKDPERVIIQTNQPIYMGTNFVLPRTSSGEVTQGRSCNVFNNKYPQTKNKTSPPPFKFCKNIDQWGKSNCRYPINGKHPNIGISFERHIVSR